MINEEITEAIISDMLVFFNNNECFSETRDIFAARLQSYILESKKYLEAAIIGEIGNNTFDHNFVFENNRPRGVYSNYTYKQKYAIIADYGRGIFGSLSTVLPSIGTELEAMETAFTKRISGRSPEQRGNGLKFVSETIQQNNLHLYFQSGCATCSIDGKGISFCDRPLSVKGCLAILDFNKGI